MRFFAAAMGRRSKGSDPGRASHVDEIVQLRVRKCPVDVSVSFPRVSPVEVVSRRERFRAARARGRPSSGRRFRTRRRRDLLPPRLRVGPAACSRADAKAHVAGEGRNSLLTPPDAALGIFAMADHRGLGESDERIHQDREARRARQPW